MGRLFHGAHTHGRVFHGEEARKMLALHRRDSHGDKKVMHVPAELDNKANFIHNAPGMRQNAAGKDVKVETVESVVYVTMPQTFGGDAQLSTATGESSGPNSADAAAAYESAKAAAGQPTVQQSSAPVEVAAEPSSSSKVLYTAPQPRTRTTESSQSLQTGPMQVSKNVGGRGNGQWYCRMD